MGSTAEFFAPRGVLSRAHPTYEVRTGQQAMALAVAETFEHGGRLMVEAGTGTGKTLAYLVPALLSGRRVVVSTGTRNLQDQIAGHDLPFLAERAGLSAAACVVKGRENYACRLRLDQFAREPLFEDVAEAPWIGRIVDWQSLTTTGDRAEIADLPDRLRVWRDVNARADTCSGSRCPEYEPCWLTRLKRRAQRSQLLVVNHHLFFADLALRSAYGAVLPDYDTVVFDEAHLLEEIATLYFGLSVSAAEIEDLAREAERLAARAGGPARGGGGAAVLRPASREFWTPLRDRLDGAPGRLPFDPAARGGPDLEAEWAVLSEALDEVARQGEALASLEPAADTLPRRARDLRNVLDRVLARDRTDHVYGMEPRGRANLVLSASPIDVGDLLRARLFDDLHACVLTSATLAVEGSFEFFQRRLGLADAATLAVGSPFDHERQAVLYLPRAMPEPRAPGFAARAVEEIAGLLEITGGRAFLLFTSWAGMARVRDALAVLDRWPLLAQGEGSKPALVERFRTTPGAVLCGTTSFWHGVDVPGEALSLVVVDKLPFDVPSDPLLAARIERIRSEGGNPFSDYQVPLAVLELKQGLGRLLRRGDDRGILAVLDPRLTSRGYGRAFLRSLPPWRIVRDRAACAAFFGADATPGAGLVDARGPAPPS